MKMLTLLRAWWQRQMEAVAKAPPYPLTQDEWDFILESEQVPVGRVEAPPKAKSYVDENGNLGGINAGGLAQY